MTTDFGPVPASQFKGEANRIFSALEQGRRVLLSRYGKVVALIDPPSMPRHSNLLAAYALSRPDAMPELTASEIAQGSPSEFIHRAEEGAPSLVTRSNKVYGVLRALPDEPIESDPDEEERLLAQFEKEHPDATPAEFAAEVARVIARDSDGADIARSEQEAKESRSRFKALLDEAQAEADEIVSEARDHASRVREESERELAAALAQRDSISAQLTSLRQMLASLSTGIAPEEMPGAAPASGAAAGDTPAKAVAGLTTFAALRGDLSSALDYLTDIRLWSDAIFIEAVAFEQRGQVAPAKARLTHLIGQLGGEKDAFLRRRVRAARVELARIHVAMGSPDVALLLAREVLSEVTPDPATAVDDDTTPAQPSDFEHA